MRKVIISVLFLTTLFAETRLESYEKFIKVVNMIEAYYVDEINTSTIINKALKGLLPELDAHSSYLDKRPFKALSIIVDVFISST